MQQLPLDGMPRRLYSCTPTRLNSWLDCPRRYRFGYLDRPAPAKGPPWAHNSVGTSVHNALAAWWREPYERRTPAMAGVLLTSGWITEGFADSEQSTRWRDRSRDLVMRYVSTLDPSAEPMGVERTVATRTSVIAVSGRIDRLDRRGDELVVVDYKTGHRPLTSDDARSSLALAIYAVASARVLRRPCRKVELHHIPTGSIVSWEHTDESLARHLSRADAIATEAAAADERYRAWSGPAPRRTRDSPAPAAPREVPPELDAIFPPRPGPLCAWCDYRRHCPEGQSAGPAKLPWSALPEDPRPAAAGDPGPGATASPDRPT